MTVNEFWSYLLLFENEYSVYRKKIMKKFSLTAAETDIIMFLANNPGFDTAAQISKIRKIPKSQVSLSVNSLHKKNIVKGIFKEDNKKSIHLILTDSAKPIVSYGHAVQEEFSDMLFKDFSLEDKQKFFDYHLKMAKNIGEKKECK